MLTPVDTWPGFAPELGVDPPDRARTAPRAATQPDPKALAAMVDRRTTRWELGASRLLAFGSVVGLVASLASWPAVGAELAVALALLAAVSALYFTLYHLLLDRAREQVPSWIPWLNATVEGALPTVALLVVAAVTDAPTAIASQLFLLYAVLIAASASRLRPWMCFYVGAVGVATYLILYHAMLRPETIAAFGTLPDYAHGAGWSRGVWLLVTALVVAYATFRVRRLAVRTGAEAWRRRRLERELGRFVSRDVAEAILAGTTSAAERRDVTVLFCDLRDFTSMCERQAPETMVELLNTFYERACTVVEAHGGTVNKFLGDGLLALFGAPHEHPEHPWAAAAAAHEIMYAADELRARGGVWKNLDVGIGLDSGDVVVGPVGAASRAEYTAIGNTVNRAARLQGLSRKAKRRIVLSDDYVRRLGPRASVVSIGAVKLKGLSEPVDVFAFRHS